MYVRNIVPCERFTSRFMLEFYYDNLARVARCLYNAFACSKAGFCACEGAARPAALQSALFRETGDGVIGGKEIATSFHFPYESRLASIIENT